MRFKILNRFATKEETDQILRRVDRFHEAMGLARKDNSELGESVGQLRRILENYIPGRIISQSYECGAKIIGLSYRHIPRFTYIYKDGREYEIKGLTLNNPEFEVLNSNNVIRALDIVKNTVVEYVIDLNNCTVVKTSEG